jgi:hypothetical protein
VKRVLIVSVIIFLSIKAAGYAYDWPTKPFNKQDSIWATLGEVRDSSGIRHHFHKGVDIRQSNGDTVYSVVDSGIVHSISTKGFWIDDYQYYHVTRLSSIGDSDTVMLNQAVATIMELNHLHFREKSNDSPPYNALNPLRDGGFISYVDSTNPHIDTIKFYRQGPGDTLLHKDSLDRRVDVLSVAGDTRTDSIGHSPADTGKVSIYRIGYLIKDTLGNVVKPYWEKIKFDTIAGTVNLSQLNLTYGPGSTHDPPHFRYWVTNDPFNDTTALRNWYWNTKQQINEPDSVDADSIEDAKFKDGYYWVKVLAYDIEDNADSESVYVHVDNFNPKVKESRPSPWFAFVPNKQKTIWLKFSEAMDTGQGIRISEDTLRCRHDSLETRQDIRISGNGNFLNYEILNINTKINRSFFEIICNVDIAYNSLTIKQKPRRYGGKTEDKKL